MEKYLLANEDTYEKLMTFESVEEMDEAIRKHKDAHKLNKGELKVLEVLQRHSCKYPGVSFMTNRKIGEIVGKRRETVSRIRKSLESKGIIKQYPLKRDGGDRRETASAAVVQREEAQEETESAHPKRTPKTAHHKASYKASYKASTHIRDGERAKRGLKTAIPKIIYEAISPFFDVKGLYDTYGILLRAKASIDHSRTITFEEHGQAFVDEFYNIIRKYKAGEVRSLPGLLYSAWQKVTAEIGRRQAQAQGGSPLYYDWLTEGNG
jgi:DNA-binding MarR family transcriptional regulator